MLPEDLIEYRILIIASLIFIIILIVCFQCIQLYYMHNKDGEKEAFTSTATR